MIADILFDLNLYIDGLGYAGKIKDLKLPAIKNKMMGYQAGGMAAEIDVPMGRIEKMEAEATILSFSEDILKLYRILPGQQFSFTARGVKSSDDGTQKPVLVAMQGLLTEIDMDTWKPGEEMPLKIKMTLRYYRLENDGKIIYEIDPINYKFIVMGKDLLETARQHLAI